MATPKIQSKNIYLQMDHATGNNKKDLQILDRISNILEQNGFTVHRVMGNRGLLEDVGSVFKYIIRNNVTNSLVIHIVNGLYVPTIREMIQTDENDGKGYWYAQRAYKPKGNVGMQAYFFGAPDMFNPGGAYYEVLDTRKSGGRLVRPTQFMAEHGVLWTYEPADYTGEATAHAIVDLVNKNMGITTPDSSNSNTSTIVPNTDNNQDKTLTEQTITEVYTAPYYQQVFTAKTDSLGTYNIPLELPFAGKYAVDVYYAGNKDYQAYTVSSEIINYAGSIFQEELIEKTITSKYTDGTTDTKVEGNKTGYKHTTTKIKTSTYKNGAIDTTKENTVSNDKVIIVNPDIQNTTINPAKVTPNTSNANTSYKDPYATVIQIKNGVPDVASMKHNEKLFQMVDLTRMYPINKVDYLEVFERDSKCLQLNNYIDSKYTAFYDDTKSKYFVIERERWNAIEESIYYYRTKEDGKRNYTWVNNYPFPEKIIVDFPNKRTKIVDKDVWIPWKAEKCTYPICADHQDAGRDCGPTAASVATQALHKQQTEAEMENRIHAIRQGGSAPEQIQSALKSAGFTAVLFKGRDNALAWLHENKPLVFHVKDHYNTWVDVLEDNSKVLTANSTLSTDYGPQTGWSSPSSSVMYYYSVKVGLAWNITEEEKNRLNNFYKSMGGTWDKKPNPNETLRQYWN